MGGGSMIRGAARFVGAAAAMGGASTAPPAGAFCHVSSPSMRPPSDHLSSSSDLAHKETTTGSALTSKSVGVLRHDDLDDWEYPAQEEWSDRSRTHLVFSPVPTEDEVEAATNELHAALHLSIPVSNSVLEGSSNDPASCVSAITSRFGQMEISPAGGDGQENSDKSSMQSSILSNHLGMLAAGSSSVYQAFVMMQTNPQVKGVVKSLACDPAVWKAVLDNEKIQELAQSLQGREEMLSDKKSSFPKGENEEINLGTTFAAKIFAGVTERVWQLMDKIVEIVSAMFGSVEKTLSSKGIGGVDRTVASCIMLAVAVLLVVVIKRVPSK